MAIKPEIRDDPSNKKIQKGGNLPKKNDSGKKNKTRFSNPER